MHRGYAAEKLALYLIAERKTFPNCNQIVVAHYLRSGPEHAVPFDKNAYSS